MVSLLGAGERRVVGLDDTGLCAIAPGRLLADDAAAAWRRLVARGARAGHDLAVASAWRSYQRQASIYNAKARGERRVVDDHGAPLARALFSDRDWLFAVLRFTALPGTSRHHWGSDLDVYDATALGAATLQLEAWEYTAGGPFAALTAWLDERIAADDAEGFYRPFAVDCGGVAPEPWHLSHRPSAGALAGFLNRQLLPDLWAGVVDEPAIEPLELGAEVAANLDEIWRRFVCWE